MFSIAKTTFKFSNQLPYRVGEVETSTAGPALLSAGPEVVGFGVAWPGGPHLEICDINSKYFEHITFT